MNWIRVKNKAINLDQVQVIVEMTGDDGEDFMRFCLCGDNDEYIDVYESDMHAFPVLENVFDEGYLKYL